MPDEKEESRIKIEDLPTAEKELTAEEAKNVKGGLTAARFELTIDGHSLAIKPQDADTFAGDGLGSARSKPQ